MTEVLLTCAFLLITAFAIAIPKESEEDIFLKEHQCTKISQKMWKCEAPTPTYWMDKE